LNGAALFLFASLVNDVRGLIAQHDFTGAERAVRAIGIEPAHFGARRRAFLDGPRRTRRKRYDQAESYAAETRTMALELLGTANWMAIAGSPRRWRFHRGPRPGARGRGERPEAIAFLRQQLHLFGATSLGERIRKNINLLTWKASRRRCSKKTTG